MLFVTQTESLTVKMELPELRFEISDVLDRKAF